MSAPIIMSGSLGEKYGSLEVIGTDVRHVSSGGFDRPGVMVSCDCGTQKIIALDGWKRGGYRSCGLHCPFYGHRKQHPSITTAKTIFIQNYDDGDLTFEQFHCLSQSNCHYCNSSPSNAGNIFRKDGAHSPFSIENGLFVYSGLDRVDSSRAHDHDNVVPCCIICNHAKSNQTVLEFARWIISVHTYWIKAFSDDRSFPSTEQLLELAFKKGISIPQKMQPISDGNPNRYGSVIVLETWKEGGHTRARCICDCGREQNIRLDHLKNGFIKSCNRRCPYHGRAQHPIITSAKDVFVDYKRDGNLPFDQFYLLSQLDCWYCGKPATNSNRYNIFEKSGGNDYSLDEGTYRYNGLDRIDSDKGHDVDNVVPCCIACNSAKIDLTVDEFFSWLVRAYSWACEFWKSKNNEEENIGHQRKFRGHEREYCEVSRSSHRTLVQARSG